MAPRTLRHPFACTLAAIAAALSLGACGSDDDASAGPSGASNDAATLCVDTINRYRATLNLPPYGRWTEKESCADGQAQSDSASGKAHGAFGRCGESAQNECPGWSGDPAKALPGCLEMMWNEGPGAEFSEHGHYLNMSSTKYTKVACGFHAAGGVVWAVQDFR